MESNKKISPEEAIRNRIHKLTENVFPEYQKCIDEVVSVFQTLGHLEKREPISNLLNQSANDFHDLGNELESGRGRAATRTARALIEHTINFYSIISDEAALKRYGEQFSVSVVFEKNARIGADELPKKERKVYVDSLEKAAKEHQERNDTALAAYGSSFRRQWNTENLYDRAVRHGIDDLYDYYKMASVVMHGSSGGARGTLFSIEGQSIYRLGPAINLCPLAYHEGVRAFSVLIEKIHEVFPSAGAGELTKKVSTLRSLWPKYRKGVLALDKELTPNSAFEVAHCCALISGTGTVKWAIVSPNSGWIMFCEEPDSYKEAGRYKDSIQQMRKQVSENFDHDHWEPIGLPGESLTPLPGGKKYPLSNFFDGSQRENIVTEMGFKKKIYKKLD